MFHILVVDDDKHTRMLLRAVLENAHYTVTTATNGEEAVSYTHLPGISVCSSWIPFFAASIGLPLLFV